MKYSGWIVVAVGLSGTVFAQSECERTLSDLQLRHEAVTAELARAQGFRVVNEGFQRAKWGMGPAELKKLYPKAEVVDKNKLLVKSDVAGRPAITSLELKNDKLNAVTVVFTQEPNEGAVTEFSDLKSLLSEKYGEPEVDDLRWSNGTQINLVRAISQGQAAFTSRWETEKTRIELTLRGERSKPQMKLRYQSTEERAQRAELERQKLEDL